ncbi:MAG TPA: hypothetical protein VKE22_06920 [Haliangiales bacterium]|nr:hypothetical protein [Haliangiales bacterium]
MRWCALLAASVGLGGCTSSDSTGAPKAEVAETEIKLDLPTPPDFPDPKPYADGSHSVTEMRLKGQKFLDKSVKISGFVVYKYDLDACAAEEGEKKVKADPKLCEGKKDIAACTKDVGKKIVADSPDVCDRPYFYLADSANASFEKSLWVVDVPRPLRDDEKRDPGRVEEFKKAPPPPQISVGQKVTVEGQWAVKSPSGFGNSDGLLVYAGLQPAP